MASQQIIMHGVQIPPQSSMWICMSCRTSPGALFFISKTVGLHAIAGFLMMSTFALWTHLSKWLAKWSYGLKRLQVALTAIRIPERVHLQAMQVLLRYRRKRVYARRMRRTGYLIQYTVKSGNAETSRKSITSPTSAAFVVYAESWRVNAICRSGARNGTPCMTAT